MPRTLRLADGGYMRRPDVERIIRYLDSLQCVEVIGFSNVGKSALLRLLSQADVWTHELGEAGQEFMPVYIDCNRMLGMSDQGFYELVLRCLQESYSVLADLPELSAAYETLVTPASEFQVPLSFNRGLTAALETLQRRMVLLFDEFDEPFTGISSRVFLNLRALKDRHSAHLAYVTATGKPLNRLRAEDHCSEFCELFNHHTWYLAPLTRPDEERLIRRYMEMFDAPFVGADIDFVRAWAGGHPVLLEGVCRILEATLTNGHAQAGNALERWEIHRGILRELRTDSSLTSECEKIWNDCSDQEKAALQSLYTPGADSDQTVLGNLERRHLLLRVEGKHQPFCRLFAEYIQRTLMLSQPDESRLWVDVESGDVLVDGQRVETLTNLEYKLMLLLFQNVEKIIDKYEIVSHVWGDSYIDEVDDARIEKLVSRLRQKIEPDTGNPRFLTTVRGRGYRLIVT